MTDQLLQAFDVVTVLKGIRSLFWERFVHKYRIIYPIDLEA
jgi:hypothetical protein